MLSRASILTRSGASVTAATTAAATSVVASVAPRTIFFSPPIGIFFFPLLPPAMDVWVYFLFLGLSGVVVSVFLLSSCCFLAFFFFFFFFFPCSQGKRFNFRDRRGCRRRHVCVCRIRRLLRLRRAAGRSPRYGAQGAGGSC